MVTSYHKLQNAGVTAVTHTGDIIKALTHSFIHCTQPFIHPSNPIGYTLGGMASSGSRKLVAQGALALKCIIELSQLLGQVLQHDPRTYSTMSLVLRVFWLPSVTSLFITPEFQNSNALLAQEWVGGPGGVST